MNSDDFSAFSAFLEYGPLGLAGLMLVLTIFAMTTAELSDSRAGLLRFFLSVGGICFLATLVFEYMRVDHEHNLVVFVAPHDVIQNQGNFPPPNFNVNGINHDRKEPILINSDSQIRVDVSEAIGLYELSEAQIVAQRETLEAQEAELTRRESDLARSAALLAEQESQLEEQEARIASQRKSINVQRSELERREAAMLQAQRTIESVSLQIDALSQQIPATEVEDPVWEMLKEDLAAPVQLLRP